MNEDRWTEDGKKEGERVPEERMQARSDAVIGFLKDRGMLPEKEIGDAALREARQERRRNAYHNTLLLLQHYRTLVWLLECFPDNIAEELDRPFEGLDGLVEQIDFDMAWGNKKLEHRLEGVKKSRLLMDRVNEALTVLKKKPGNGEKLYRLIYLTYIAPERLTHTELLYRLDMSSRSYYRARQQAVTVLSLRLWSAPGMDVDVWLELVALLESLEE